MTMIWRSSRWTVETLVRYKTYSVFALVYKWEKPSSFFDCLMFSFQKKPTCKNYVNLKISQIYFDWLLKSFWGEIMGVVFMSQSLVQCLLYFHTSWLLFYFQFLSLGQSYWVPCRCCSCLMTDIIHCIINFRGVKHILVHCHTEPELILIVLEQKNSAMAPNNQSTHQTNKLFVCSCIKNILAHSQMFTFSYPQWAVWEDWRKIILSERQNTVQSPKSNL